MRIMPVPTALVDPETQQFREVNDAWCSALRRTRNELLSMTWVELSAAADVHRSQVLAQQLVNGERDSFRQSKRYVRGDGTMLAAEIEVCVVRDEAGRDICHVVQFIDVPDEGSMRAVLRLLTDAPSADAVAAGIAQGLLADLEPEIVVLSVLDHGQHVRRVVGQYGLSAEDMEGFGEVSLDLRLPGYEVARTGVEMSMSVADMVAAYPLTAGWAKNGQSRQHGEIVIWPLVRRGLVVGTLLVSTLAPIERTWELHARFGVLVLALAAWVQIESPAMDPRRSAAGHVRSPVTERQQAILRMLRDGFTNAEIADRIGYSVATVRADLAALYRALGARGRSDVLGQADRAGL